MMYHCCLDVEASRDRDLPIEWRAMCVTAKALGYKVIPIGTACDNFDYQHGCRGHAESIAEEGRKP